MKAPGLVDSFAIDWVTEKIYFVHSSSGGDEPAMKYRIEVMTLDGKYRRVLFWDKLATPKYLQFDATTGYLYWIDGGEPFTDVARIERGAADGSSRETLLESKMLDEDLTEKFGHELPKYPSGLALDAKNQVLYWSDYGEDSPTGKGKLCAVDLRNKKFAVILDGLSYPFGVEYYDVKNC